MFRYSSPPSRFDCHWRLLDYANYDLGCDYGSSTLSTAFQRSRQICFERSPTSEPRKQAEASMRWSSLDYALKSVQTRSYPSRDATNYKKADKHCHLEIDISGGQAIGKGGAAARRSNGVPSMSAATSTSDRKMLYCSLRKFFFASLTLVSQSYHKGGLCFARENLSASLLGQRFRSFDRDSQPQIFESPFVRAFFPPLRSNLLLTRHLQLLTYLVDL